MGNIPLFYNIFVIFFPLSCVFAFTPYMGKKNSIFGVFLPEDAKNNTEIIKISRQYTFFALVAGVCLAATSFVVNEAGISVLCAVIYICMCLAMFAVNNKLIRNIIAVNDYENFQKPVYVKTVTSEFKPKTISMLWLLIMLIPTAVSFYDAYVNTTDIWFVIPIIQLAICIVDVIGFILIKRTSQYVNKNTAAEDMRRNLVIRKKLSALVLWLSFALSVFLTFMQLCFSKTIICPIFLTVAPFVSTVAVTACIIGFCMNINKI